MYDTRVTKMEQENVKNMYSRNDKKGTKFGIIEILSFT